MQRPRGKCHPSSHASAASSSAPMLTLFAARLHPTAEPTPGHHRPSGHPLRRLPPRHRCGLSLPPTRPLPMIRRRDSASADVPGCRARRTRSTTTGAAGGRTRPIALEAGTGRERRGASDPHRPTEPWQLPPESSRPPGRTVSIPKRSRTSTGTTRTPGLSSRPFENTSPCMCRASAEHRGPRGTTPSPLADDRRRGRTRRLRPRRLRTGR